MPSKGLRGTPTKHHLVPEFYLRHFSRKGRVEVFSKKRRLSYRVSVEKAARVTHFYSLDLLDGSRSLEIEELMSRVEGRAGSAIKKVIDGRLPEQDEKTAIAQLMALQVARAGEWREVIADVLLEFKRKLEGVQHLDVPSDEVAVTAAKNLHLRSIDESVMMFSEALLSRKHWIIVMFREVRLLTSDAPVIALPPGTGLLDAAVVTFPIGQGCALMLLNNKGPGPIVDGDASLAMNINLHVANQAEDLVFMLPNVDYGIDWLP